MKQMSRLWAIGLSMLIAVSSAKAGEPHNTTDGEIAMLPEYCADKNWSGRKESSPERRAHWAKLLGPSWEGLHHYCWGLVSAWRAKMKPSSQEKSFMLDEAIADYDYAIRNSTADFVLLPELWYRMGEAQLARGRAAAGIDALNHSIKAKNDYWPAYLLIAASYEKLRLYNDAIAALNSGLEVDAGQKDLMRELERLKSARSRAGSSTEKTDSRTPRK